MIWWQNSRDLSRGALGSDAAVYGTDQLCCKPSNNLPALEFNGEWVIEIANAHASGRKGTFTSRKLPALVRTRNFNFPPLVKNAAFSVRGWSCVGSNESQELIQGTSYRSNSPGG